MGHYDTERFQFGNNLYGDHRFMVGIHDLYQYYGIFLLNSNAMGEYFPNTISPYINDVILSIFLD